MLILSNVLSRVRTRFDAESSVRWDDETIIASINEGLDELSEGAQHYERIVSIPVTRRSFYDLRGFIPDDVISVRAVWSTIRQDWLIPTSEEKLGRRWEETVGDSYHFFLRGWSWLGVFPHPAGDSSVANGFLRVYFNCLAPQLGHSQAVLPDLPDDFSPMLEDYALYDLQAQDGETDKALGHWTDFAGRQKKLTSFVASRGRSSGFIGGR
jgi:hypothetical protein